MTTTKTKKRSASSGGSRGRTASKGGGKRSKPAKIRTFKRAVAALLDRADVERTRQNRIPKDTFFLDRMTSLLEALDNPHQSVDAIHIAGSVGKGSTAAMLDSTLRGCGWAVGTFTSPHLLDVRERIMLNGTMISDEVFTHLTARVNQAALEVAPDATFFELITAMAFLHFAEEAVDMAVLETGLGGRLDTTNLCRPTVTLLTRIELDHMDLLGRDLASIAREKAGIMKAGVPAYSVAQEPEVEAVLREVACPRQERAELPGHLDPR